MFRPHPGAFIRSLAKKLYNFWPRAADVRGLSLPQDGGPEMAALPFRFLLYVWAPTAKHSLTHTHTQTHANRVWLCK